MDWKKHYRDNMVSADTAVKKIGPKDRVVLSHAVGEPGHLVEALIRNRETYSRLEIVHMVPMGPAEYCKPGMEKFFRHNALFAGKATKEAIRDGRGDFTPCHFSRVPQLFKKELPVDVALVQVTPPDEHGFCSLGVSADYTLAATKSARVVVVQVNSLMPRTHGNTFVHVSEIDCFVLHDAPLLELSPPALSDVEKKIGENCASLIRDGDCLQLGIGAIPDAVLSFLTEKKDLGIHSEMISDGVVNLMEAGVINNRRKNLHQGKCVVTFLMGSRRLYDYVNDNPSIVLFPVDYVNDPWVAGQNDNLVSINSCVQIDLLGQACSEMVGPLQISATGGQVDFIRAAAISKGGRSILAVPSTTANGQISRIVSMLDVGAAVTTSRYDIEYIVTEYGIAALKGRTVHERARALIQIAHPKFRDALIADFEDRFCTSY